jgi:DUF1680 family protein
MGRPGYQPSTGSGVKFRTHFDKGLLGGINVLQGQALVLPRSDWGEALYRVMSPQALKAVDIRMVPYYAWDNRGRSEMTVWLPLR